MLIPSDFDWWAASWHAATILRFVANDPFSRAAMRATGITLVFVGGWALIQAWEQANENKRYRRRHRNIWQEALLGSSFTVLGVVLILSGVLG